MAAVAKQVDLLEHIDFANVECLNESAQHTWCNALKKGYREDHGIFLESDADEQLLINIPFTSVVKLHSLIIRGLGDGTAPKTVKLFVNTPSMGFSDAESKAAVQEFTVSGNGEDQVVELKFVKFQSVHMLSVFFADNADDEDTTKLVKLSLVGSPVDTTNMKEFKKVC